MSIHERRTHKFGGFRQNNIPKSEILKRLSPFPLNPSTNCYIRFRYRVDYTVSMCT